MGTELPAIAVMSTLTCYHDDACQHHEEINYVLSSHFFYFYVTNLQNSFYIRILKSEKFFKLYSNITSKLQIYGKNKLFERLQGLRYEG